MKMVSVDEVHARIDFAGTVDIDKVPAIDAEPVRHGRWQWEPGYVGMMAVCSCCGRSPMGFYSLPINQIGRLPVYDYCPRCGAKMENGKGQTE